MPTRSNARILAAAPPIVLLLLAAVFAPRYLPAQTPGAAPALKIGGEVTTPLSLSLADLKKMPRQTLKVVNPHSKKRETYQGVSLQELLHRAGVPQGEKLRGKAMSTYVLATAADGYRVVFSLAELDSGFLDSDVIVADTLDGAPLGPNEGPLKLVAPRDKRPARWIRMVKSLTVLQAGD
jgi:DMSO/TMAO reductase YedYZ molybdopterin-dependent catalytic subunit